MRLLVCGGRTWANEAKTTAALDAVHAKRPIALIIHGGASGADAHAGAWAEAHGVPVMVFHAAWSQHGRAAGPIRNEEMLFLGRPEGVLAMPGERGTRHMVGIATRDGVTVWAPYGIDMDQTRQG